MATIQVRMPDGSLQAMSHPDNWSDDQVKSAIYKNFPNVNKSDTNVSKTKQGLAGIGEDIKSTLNSLPSDLVSSLINLPSHALNVAKQITDPSDMLRPILNVGGGVRKGLEGLANIPANVAGYLSSKDIGNKLPEGSLASILKENPLDLIKKLRIPESGLEESLLGAPKQGDEELRALGSLLPYAKIGGAAKGLEGLVKRSGSASAYATGQNQDPLKAALMTLIGEGTIRGGTKGIKSLDPANLFKGHLSPEELKANLKAAQGTNTPLGRIIESPTLNTLFENVTSEVPFSGADTTLGKIKNQIKEEGSNIIDQTEPEGIQGDNNYALKKALTDAFYKNRQIKNDIYTERNQIADKELFTPDLTNFNKLASELKTGIKGSAFYKINPAFKSLFNKVSGIEKGSDMVSQGKPKQLANDELTRKGIIVSPTITESTMLARDLDEKGGQLLKSTNSSDKAAGGLYKQLSKTLRNDVESSIENKGSQELKEAHEKANKNFIENYVPFLDEDIDKILKKKDAQSLVAKIVKPSKKFDEYKTIEKINSLVSPEESKLLGNHYLKGSLDKFGRVKPKKLASLIENLGDRQFQALFPNKEVQMKLKNYSTLRNMNEKALNLMYNPQTGAKNVKLLLGGVAAGMAPHTAAGAYLGSVGFNKLMTNPKAREWLVNRMIEKQGQGIK